MEDKVYTTLCVLFATILILGNLIYQKIVFLPIFSWHTFELSVGVILYPLTFFITDLITEFYGKERAVFCIRLALTVNLLMAGLVYFFDQLKCTPWSNVDDDVFSNVFGYYSTMSFASIMACYISQRLDTVIYLTLKQMTKDKLLWLRNFTSSSLSLFIDTIVVMSLLAYFNAIPVEKATTLITNSYIFKLFMTVAALPFYYIAFWLVRALIK